MSKIKEGDSVNLESMAEYIIKQTRAKYQYWQKYANIFEDKVKEIEKDKEGLAKVMMEDPKSEQAKATLLFSQYDYNMHVQDLNTLLEEYIVYYRMSRDLDLTDQFSESQNNKSMKIIDSDKELTFFVDGDSLEERVEGGRKEYIDKINSNPDIVKIAEQMAELMKK